MTSTRTIRHEAAGYAEDARGLASHALESTREFANHAFDRAGSHLRDLRSGATGYASATSRYIADEPVKSALIAAAVGAVVAGIVIAMRRSNTTTRY